jgi:hypothetical protein
MSANDNAQEQMDVDIPEASTVEICFQIGGIVKEGRRFGTVEEYQEIIRKITALLTETSLDPIGM